MHDLTGQHLSSLVNESMNAGNTTASNPDLAMTAPGSESVLPVSERLDVLPQPRFTNPTPIPVSHPGIRDRVRTPARPEPAGAWRDVHDRDDGGGWRWELV
jgi:hypothetical protein